MEEPCSVFKYCKAKCARHLRLDNRLDVRALAEEVASLVLHHQEDGRLRWYEDGRVRVLIGKVLPKGSAAKPTLAGRRKWFREALRQRLAAEGWLEAGVNVIACA